LHSLRTSLRTTLNSANDATRHERGAHCACARPWKKAEKVSESVRNVTCADTSAIITRRPRWSFGIAYMPICHDHNLARPVPRQLPFGIRVKLRSTDPFKNLVGGEWTKEHWFATREERDRAMKEMSGRYVYFRPGDQPTLEYEKVDR
jgi:hypothetical protein